MNTNTSRTKSLSYDAAMTLMRRPDARLVRMNGRGGGYYVTGGGPVGDVVAVKIIAHPLVRGGKDGLFPNHDQTWRMIS
jgi:hypothetical protein